MAIELTLLGRSYCHLCHEMEVALVPLAEDFGASVEVIDIDGDPLLQSRYDELVPVLLHGDTELCHYFLDIPKTREYLAEIR
ncbi:MAG: glutaredoxin family protein [Azonexus sp.]|jgi:thioredoxin reductase (NADPH)